MYKALSKIREAKVIAMEDYVAKDQRPLQVCLDDVASCDIYVGIVAWRYGHIPDDKKDNPKNLSITELEYRKAREKGIPCLVFLLDEKVGWPPQYSDGTAQSGKSHDNINRLRQELRIHTIDFFKKPDQLGMKVLAAVYQKLTITKSSQPEYTESMDEIPIIFKGEKKVFVGRDEYIDNTIKQKIQLAGSIVSLVGPGGSGKTQLAYKAMRQYVEEEKLFDIVITIYFGKGVPLFSSLLSKMAESLGMSIADYEKQPSMEKRKQTIIKMARAKRHPILYLDNYETISFDLNRQRFDKSHKPSDDALQIEYFLKNDIPNNTSILLTSREANNRLGESPIELQGLQNGESKEMFYKLTRPIIKDNAFDDDDDDGKVRIAIDKIIRMTGGHPLSIEIIATNIDNIYDIEKMANEIRIGEASINNPDERLRTLQACFDYTVNRLNERLRALLLKLTLFISPFPKTAPVKILSSDDDYYSEDDIVQL